MRYTLTNWKDHLLIQIQLQLISRVLSVCMTSPLTSILDHELDQIGRIELTMNHYINATLNAYSNPQSCDREVVTSNTPLHSRSLCPWDYVLDVDENRFPPTLTMARCKCTKCLNNYACKPVLYSINVLQKECKNGMTKWTRRAQLISVACACSRPAVMQVKRKRLSTLLNIRSLYDVTDDF